MALEKRAEQQQQQQDQEPSSCRRSVPVDNDDRLQSHTSTLPNFLYPYSFCGPIPSVFKHPWEFLKHPLVLLFIGFWAAIASGVSLPGGGLVYGVWTNAITGEYDPDYKMERSRFTGWVMTLVGVGAFLLSWLFLYCFSTASELMAANIRRTYVGAVIIQDQAFFEKHGPGEIASRAGKDINSIRTAYGEKMGYIIWSLGNLIASIIMSFILAARLSGIMFAVVPFGFLVIVVSSYFIHISSEPISSLEGKASSLTEQIFSSIRIAQTFSMQNELVRKLDNQYLKILERLGKVRAWARALEQAGIYFTLFVSFSLNFWASGIEVVNGVSVGYAMTIFWNMINALFALANVLPHLASLADAGVAIQVLRRQIERRPYIDIRDPKGIVLPSHNNTDEDSGPEKTQISSPWVPEFRLQDITFAYPSRPNVKSLDDVSLTIEAGKMTAFVGHSGSGKSTTVGLLLREYDPETSNLENPSDEMPKNGDQDNLENPREDEDSSSAEKGKSDSDKSGLKEKFMTRKKKDVETAQNPEALEKARIQGSGVVYFAGRDIRDYNLKWYRKQLSVVSQAPQLFSTSIFGNVAAGLTGTQWEYRPDIDTLDSPDETIRSRMVTIRQLVEDALRKAQAWEFVVKLPEGVDTMITGGRAQLLSGGQRQRVALARALVSKPAVLLLDEATSALDTASEDRIRVMLEKEQAERGMTLIVIAHRLSTIQGADKIFVMSGGRVVDEGTYHELGQAGRKDQTFRNMIVANQEQQTEDSPHQDFDSMRKSAGNRKKSDYATDMSDESCTVFSGSTYLNTTQYRPTPGTETPPRVSNTNRSMSSSSTTMKRPEPHVLFGGRGGSTITRAEHAGGESALEEKAEDDRDTASIAAPPSSHYTRDEPDIKAADLDPLKPKHYGRGTLIKRYWDIMGRHRHLFFLFGVLCAIAAGGGWPIEAWLVGEAVEVLSITGDDDAVRSGSNKWALWFLILTICIFFAFLFNGLSFEVTSERVVRNLKRGSMRSLLHQEIGYFESSDETDAGALTAALSTNPTNITNATGLILSQIVIALANLAGSFILGFIFSWKLSVVVIPCIFAFIVSAWLNIAMLDKYEAQNAGPSSRCASFLSETIDVVRTITSLNYQSAAMANFEKKNSTTKRSALYLNFGAIGFAFSQGAMDWLQALLFFWGGKLVAREGMTTKQLFACYEAIVIACFAASRMLMYVGDIGRAFSGMAVMQNWMDRKPLVAHVNAENQGKESYEEGDIVLRNVELRYPRRPDRPALKNVSLTIKAGQTHAFCGSSGSGKSTIIALLLRFYEPCKGSVTYGGRDARSIPLDEFRSKCAYVSQDPQLFEGTVRWNLCLGAVDPNNVSQEALEKACAQACILDFIRGLKDGFETEIGMKGAALSGGQRQRLCIARALIREPQILFLDEATSALDATSELQVNKALANAAVGRTTITIAHRLSTIRKADVIHVIEDGNVAEEGSHNELIKRKGRYLELIEAQL